MDYNKVVLIGRLSQDVEHKQVGSTTKATTSIAINHGYKDKRESHFFSVEAWGNTSDFMKQYFAKGKPILIEGRLKQESWTDKNGEKKSRVVVVAESVHFVGGRDDAQSSKDDFGGLPF